METQRMCKFCECYKVIIALREQVEQDLRLPAPGWGCMCVGKAGLLACWWSRGVKGLPGAWVSVSEPGLRGSVLETQM